MMPIKTPELKLDDDVLLKIKVASKQMVELLTQVKKWVKYRLLTHEDKKHLIHKGFASDLVDNLVYFTQRTPDNLTVSSDDCLVLGFTDNAFDPSIYSCDAILKGLAKASAGRCYWCESLIDPNDAVVSHYRPPDGYFNGQYLQRDAYFSLAYDTNNLVYSCRHCTHTYKANQFPTVSNQHMPQVSLQDESTLLVSPYSDSPRDFIRFNPVNASAYAYDRVLRFYQEQHSLGAEEVEQLLYQTPAAIPGQVDILGNSISEQDATSQFYQWLYSLTGVDAEALSKGQASIEVLGLNRPSLLKARANHLRQLRAMYITANCQSSGTPEEAVSTRQQLEKWQAGDFETGSAVPAYLSLTIDALSTWYTQDKPKQQLASGGGQ